MTRRPRLAACLLERYNCRITTAFIIKISDGVGVSRDLLARLNGQVGDILSVVITLLGIVECGHIRLLSANGRCSRSDPAGLTGQ